MTNDLGTYSSLAEVWSKYPQGGIEGDILYINGVKHTWNKFFNQWSSTDSCIEKPARDEVNLYNDYVFNHDVRVLGKLFADAVRQPNCGLFGSLEELKETYPKPFPGYWACIGDKMPAPIYRYSQSEGWIATGQIGGVQSDNDKLDALERSVKSLEENDRRQDDSISLKVEGLVVAPIEGVSDIEKRPVPGSIVSGAYTVVYSNYNKRVLALLNGEFFLNWGEKVHNNTVIPDGVWFGQLSIQNKIILYNELGNDAPILYHKSVVPLPPIILGTYPHLYYVGEDGKLKEFITSILINQQFDINKELRAELFSLRQRVEHLEQGGGIDSNIQEQINLIQEEIKEIKTRQTETEDLLTIH